MSLIKFEKVQFLNDVAILDIYNIKIFLKCIFHLCQKCWLSNFQLGVWEEVERLRKISPFQHHSKFDLLFKTPLFFLANYSGRALRQTVLFLAVSFLFAPRIKFLLMTRTSECHYPLF